MTERHRQRIGGALFNKKWLAERVIHCYLNFIIKSLKLFFWKKTVDKNELVHVSQNRNVGTTGGGTTVPSDKKSYPQQKGDKYGKFNLYTKLSTLSTNVGLINMMEIMEKLERVFCEL